MAGVTEVGWPYTARSPYLVVVAVYTYAVSYFFLLENWKKIVGPVWWLWRVCNNAAARRSSSVKACNPTRAHISGVLTT